MIPIIPYWDLYTSEVRQYYMTDFVSYIIHYMIITITWYITCELHHVLHDFKHYYTLFTWFTTSIITCHLPINAITWAITEAPARALLPSPLPPARPRSSWAAGVARTARDLSFGSSLSRGIPRRPVFQLEALASQSPCAHRDRGMDQGVHSAGSV